MKFKSRFESDFDKDRRTFRWLFRGVMAMIIVTFLMIVTFWIGAGILAYKAVDEVNYVGMKTVLTRIWCGPGVSCL